MRSLPGEVAAPILREHGGLRGQIREDEVDERIAGAELERRVEPPLEANRRPRLSAQAFSARGSAEVGWKDLDVVWKREETTAEARVQLLREPALLSRTEKIRSANAAGEQRVAGKDESWLRRARAIRDEEADAIRRVPGRMQHLDADVPQVMLLSVVQRVMAKRNGRRGVVEDRRPCRLRQPPRTGHVIGLHVRLEDVGDAHRLFGGGCEVRLDLRLWIHHSTRGGACSAEDIAGAPGRRREEGAEDHGDLLRRERSPMPCVTPGGRIGSNTLFGTNP